MKRVILKHIDEPVEIHVIGSSAIDHMKKMLENNSMFLDIGLDSQHNFKMFEKETNHLEYVTGTPIQLGDTMEVEIAKGVFKRGTVVFDQMAYCFRSFESGNTRTTALCNFNPTVKFHKIQ